MTQPDEKLRAWRIVEAFAKATNICQCGTTGLALNVIHETLEKVPASGDNYSAWYRPGLDEQDVFAATMLDSMDLITHAGSIDAGCFRTVQGDALFRAMNLLRTYRRDFLFDPYRDDWADDYSWEPPNTPWWQW